MGIDLCNTDLFEIEEDFPNNKREKNKRYIKPKNEIIPETIQENLSIYSNPDLNERNNNKKNYNNYNNYEDINNLRSSIFDNEENDHVKKYEQEINTEEHPYIFGSEYDLNKNEEKEKECK